MAADYFYCYYCGKNFSDSLAFEIHQTMEALREVTQELSKIRLAIEKFIE